MIKGNYFEKKLCIILVMLVLLVGCKNVESNSRSYSEIDKIISESEKNDSPKITPCQRR